VRRWLQQHNQQVKRGAVRERITVCQLPSKSPWRDLIAPKWGLLNPNVKTNIRSIEGEPCVSVAWYPRLASRL